MPAPARKIPAATAPIGSGLGPGAVPFDLCRGAFAGEKHPRKAFQRFFARLPSTLKENAPGQPPAEGFIDASVTLPNGVKAGEFVQLEFPFKTPSGWSGYTEQQRTQWILAVQREQRWTRFLKARPHLRQSAPETYAEFGRAEAEWLAEVGPQWWPCGRPMPHTPSSMKVWRKRLHDRGEVPRRGAPKGGGAKTWDPRAAELFDALFQGARSANAVLRAIQAFAWKEGFEAPTVGMVRRRIDDMTAYERARRRHGKHKAEEACIPKVRRTRAEHRGFASCDGHRPDVFVQVPARNGGITYKRVMVTGVYIAESRKWSALLAGLTESAEQLSATWRASVLEDGPQPVIVTDNTHAMDGLTGSPYRAQRGRREKFAAGGLGGFFALFGTEVHKVKPRYGKNVNAIESNWRALIEAVEKFCASYCGSQPSEKPEELTRWLRDNVERLPTLDDLNRWLADFRAMHNATPLPELRGLTPNLYQERYGPARRAVDPDVVDAYLSPIVTTRVVGRDGVKLDDVVYTPEAGDLLRLQGKRVGVRRDHELADRITLCDEAGVALCRAYSERLRGVRMAAVRETERRQKAFKAAARKEYSGRDTRFTPKTSQILRVQREHAEFAERQLRKELGEAEERPVKILRPDLVDSAKRIKEADERYDGRHEQGQQRATGTGDCGAVDPADLLGRYADVEGDEDWPAIGTEFAFPEEVPDDDGDDSLLGRLAEAYEPEECEAWKAVDTEEGGAPDVA